MVVFLPTPLFLRLVRTLALPVPNPQWEGETPSSRIVIGHYMEAVRK